MDSQNTPVNGGGENVGRGFVPRMTSVVPESTLVDDLRNLQRADENARPTAPPDNDVAHVPEVADVAHVPEVPADYDPDDKPLLWEEHMWRAFDRWLDYQQYQQYPCRTG